MSGNRSILVTGGAGFIGSALVRMLVRATDHDVVNVDKLTYAGNLDSLEDVLDHPRHHFVHADISDATRMREVFDEFTPRGVLHLAAESHVDRSIDGPREFLDANVIGTFTLLQEARRFWRNSLGGAPDAFRFLHVSTDEVFGSLGEDGAFVETSPYRPNSPYSASKAAADHLVRAWHHTYGLPVVVTNCSNNYGPYQFPEKLIPLMILRALSGQRMPVYGTGANVRDWLHVDDHVRALLLVFERGRVGETYLVGGLSERRNIDVARAICRHVDQAAPSVATRDRSALIEFVPDRPGHDHRYAIDPSKIMTELGWKPQQSFEAGLRETVQWYIDNRSWWERVQSGAYRGERLGLANERV